MSQDIATILENCLEEVTTGRATVQDCLEQYPDLVGDLEPLLRMAGQVRDIANPRLTSEARARIEARFLAAVESVPSVRPTRKAHPIVGQPWRRSAVRMGLILACACLSGAGLVAVASNALPDSSLYPVKLATEDVRLWLAPSQGEPSLHLRFAEERLEEIQALAEHDVLDATVLTALAEETATALTGAEGLPPEAAVPVLQDVLQVTVEQEKVLSALIVRAGVLEQDAFARAIQTSGVHQARALQLLGSISLPERPDRPGRATPAPVLTPSASAIALPTRAPESSRTPVPSAIPPMAGGSTTPTEVPRPTMSSSPTGVPAPTETPVPLEVLPMPTETPIPPIATATTVPPAATPESRGCVYSSGYWRNHPGAWSVNALTLGNETYTQAELLDLLNEPRGGDASLILAQQLIAAELNVASGADSSAVAGSIATANAWFANYAGRLTYGVKPSSPQGQEAVALANVLDQYNNGNLPGGSPKCP